MSSEQSLADASGCAQVSASSSIFSSNHGLLDSTASRPAGDPADHPRVHRHSQHHHPAQHHPRTSPSPALSCPAPLHFALICQKLNNFTRAPDYIAYLAFILSSMPQEDDRIRTIAGYLLKNNARLILRASPDVTAFVKSAVLQAFSDSSIMIRNAAGQDVVAFLGILEPKNWPECLQQLVHLLDSPSAEQQEVRAPVGFTILLQSGRARPPSS